MAASQPAFHIDAEEIRAVVDYPGLIDALDDMHREEAAILDDIVLSQPGIGENPDFFLARAAWQRGVALGTKMGTLFPANRNSELPVVQGGYVLFDGTNGQPLASIDGTELTYLKTAADSGLGSRQLARADCRRLLMVGAGGLAPHLIRAHRAARPSINSVHVWNRSSDRRDALVQQLASDIETEPVDDLAQAVAEADIISCATMTTDPLVYGAWLQPGTHLDLVGAFKPDMREADDEAVRRSRIFVDARQTTVDDIGELMIPIAQGVITEDDVLADHYQLSGGAPGRTEAQQITLFKNGGGGHLDLMVARYIYACCRHRSVPGS
jgi:ornithine cyclodeaminase